MKPKKDMNRNEYLKFYDDDNEDSCFVWFILDEELMEVEL
jgi:hypothetical protein